MQVFDLDDLHRCPPLRCYPCLVGWRSRAGGSAILDDPMVVPGGPWIIPEKGSQGAVFALFGKRE
jgi:hypothetical protein